MDRIVRVARIIALAEQVFWGSRQSAGLAAVSGWPHAAQDAAHRTRRPPGREHAVASRWGCLHV